MNGRVVALDHGAARCGVAISDPTGTLATPLEPVLRPDTRKGLARVRA
ncbi:MAG: putative pre6S rRNA nuclease, partial [Solirubrobacteraceae bacterium]|nr:putative pre6S rRNA nuclease [Solirubrobacteraceae bacterium]